MHKILIIALFILCIVEKVFSQSPIPAKGIENILNQSREYVSQPYFTDTILVKRIDSLMHHTCSGEETFETVFQVGLSLCNMNRKEEAVKYLSYCLSVMKDVFPEIPRNSLPTYIHIMNQTGLSYNYMRLTDLAMNYYTKALDIAQKNNLNEEEAILCNNIASIFQAQKKYDESDSLFKRAIIINEELKVPQRLFVNYNNLSVNYAHKKDYNKALEYAFLAVHQLDAAKDSDMIILMQRNIGSIYLKQKESRMALQLLKQVEEYQLKHHQEYYLTGTYLIMTNVYNLLEQKEMVGNYLKKALALSDKYNNVYDKKVLLAELSNYYESIGQHRTAFEMLKQSMALKDSLYNSEEEERTRNLSGAYDEERMLQEKLIRIENNHAVVMQKVYIMVASGVVLLVVIAVCTIYWLKKQKKKTRRALCDYARQARDQMERQEGKIISLLNGQEQLKLELEQNERKQMSYSLQDTKNKEFIAQLTDRLKQLLLDMNPKETQVKKQIREIISQLNQIDSNNILQDFRDSFESIHHHFYENLNKEYPTITMKEMRLCALLRLGLSTKEIADITFKEVRSVESARNRLRKKLQISQTEDLQKFLMNF
ncbi:MAG: tetratricopeptide repeat protein [Parabacteroides merdae]